MLIRATRYDLSFAIYFRRSGQTTWTTGTMLNASRTGILLRSPIGLKTGTDLDVFFRLKPPAQVECLCRVVRSEMREEGALVGVRILSWKIDSKADLPKVVALKFADTHHRASGLATVPR